MNRLDAQRNKRSRRQALHEAQRANKVTPPPTDDLVIYATRTGNAPRRKWMKKRGFLRKDIATSLAKALASVPITWTGNCRVVFESGTYPGQTPGDK